MKQMIRKVYFATALTLVTAAAAADYGFYDKAKVIKATPIYETIEVNRPQQQCWQERVRYVRADERRNYAPAIAGALFGGVIGNQLSRDRRHRGAVTMVGALLGATVGNQIGNSRRPVNSRVVSERRCEQVDHYVEQEVVAGYRVTYRYRGKLFTTRTEQHPGRRIRIKVDVEPIERVAYNVDRESRNWDD